MKTVRLLSGVRGTAAIRRPRSLKRALLELLRTALLPVAWLWESWLSCWANHKGSEGTVHIGTSAIAELRGWEFTETMEPIDDTVLADTSRTHQAGLNRWEGSATAFWDETDATGQEACTIGASVTLKFYPEGAVSTDQFYSGTASVTGITRRAAIQGMVEVDFNFLGSGALTEAAVV